MLNPKGTLVGGTHNLPASDSQQRVATKWKQLGQCRLCHVEGRT